MKILWLSQHTMTGKLWRDLKRIYGEDVELVCCDQTVSSWKDVAYGEDVELVCCDQTISSWKDVAYVGKDCDVFAVVLPTEILADLVNTRNNRKPVIRAKANRVLTGNTVRNPATGKEEAEYRFEHAGWERVLKIEVVTKDL